MIQNRGKNRAAWARGFSLAAVFAAMSALAGCATFPVGDSDLEVMTTA